MSLSEQDIEKLKKEGIDCEKNLKPFIQAMVLWFRETWSDEYQEQLANFGEESTLEDFNSLFKNSHTTRQEIIKNMTSGPGSGTDPRDYLEEESMKIFNILC